MVFTTEKFYLSSSYEFVRRNNIFKKDIINPHLCATLDDFIDLKFKVEDRVNKVIEKNGYRLPFIPISKAERFMLESGSTSLLTGISETILYLGIPLKVVSFTFNPYEE